MRTKKSDKFKDERQALVDKLINILELDELNSFYLYDLDHDDNKQTKILALIPDVKKYYSHGLIGGIKDQTKQKRPWLSIIKHMLRDNYHFISSECLYLISDGSKVKTRRYYCNSR